MVKKMGKDRNIQNMMKSGKLNNIENLINKNNQLQ